MIRARLLAFFTVFVTIFYGSFAINNFLWSANHYLGPNPPIITVDNIARFAVISMLVIFSAITIGNVIHGTKKA